MNTLKELKEKRKQLVKIQWDEYIRRGRTEKQQRLFKQICELDEEIERRTKQ